MKEATDVGYRSVNLSILSVTEVFVGTLTTSLPPLRRLFENLLSKLTQREPPAHSDAPSRGITKRKKEVDCDDSDSERAILEDPPISVPSKSIKKTTNILMTVVSAPPAANAKLNG